MRNIHAEFEAQIACFRLEKAWSRHNKEGFDLGVDTTESDIGLTV
jgi:hypothetical protein